MNNRKQGDREEGSSLAIEDIYYILFRQKWIVLLAGVVSLVGAVTLFMVKPPLYQSEAKLYIRYVIDSEAFNVPGDGQEPRAVHNQDQSIINTELEILRSFDLARQVVEAIGPDKITEAGGGTNHDQMAGMVMRNLILDPSTKSSMINVTFQHPDREFAREVLNSVILVYYKKHADAHNEVRVLGNFLTTETARLQEELARTEQRLIDAKKEAGVVSVDDAQKAYTEQISKIRMDLFSAEEELAGHQALLEQATNNVQNMQTKAAVDTTNVTAQLAPERIEEYNRICSRLKAHLKRMEDLEFSFTTNNLLVREAREKITEIEKQKQNFEQTYPQVTLLSTTSSGLVTQATGFAGTVTIEVAQVESFKSRIETLKQQLRSTQDEAARLDQLSVPIMNLQRTRDILEGQVKFFSGKLQQAKTDESLGMGKAPNIGMIDPPTPAIRARPKTFKKQLGIVLVGPLGAGIALAFLIELFLDSTVRRPSDVEKKLRLPLFISIPALKRNGHHRIGNGKSDGTQIAVWKGTDQLRRYYEGLRDRLIVYFEIRNLTHKPKLVAVTSCGRGAGVSGVAAGLAASLSETGDGNVLLVEMGSDQPGVTHEFHKGKLCGLEHALESQTKDEAQVQENLYVAAEPVDTDKLQRVFPRRFTQLMPKLRASDYDYIIFDMPPVSQTTMTPRLAGHMDMVMLVLESEKTRREVVQKAVALLGESKANVSVVLNKLQTYVPARLHQEVLEDQLSS